MAAGQGKSNIKVVVDALIISRAGAGNSYCL